MIENQLVQPQQSQMPSSQQIENHHQHLNEFQDDIKQLLKLPDEELSLGKVFGMASDLITKHKLSKGKKGATPMEVASELASPDFPKLAPDGSQPSPDQIRKFLISQFNKSVKTQSVLTSRFAPPSSNVQPQQNPLMSNQNAG